MHQKNTYFNDPIYGFIAIESELTLKLINHPYFQRLRRISQMGLSSFVYPGANHTRFGHALGAMHIMQRAIAVLVSKGISISSKEREAMQAAILLHDIGHGPFSHATESALFSGVHHETLSLRIFHLLNEVFTGQLDLAIQIFTNTYSRKFMHQLISGQVDVDRLDYLKRDSFYTGVTEGNINTDRILAMMNVEGEQLVFENKGVHSLEKFLLARRLMYWQVYLHKTSLVAELLLVKTLQRFRYLVEQDQEKLAETPLLRPLLVHNEKEPLSEAALAHYLQLDDSDIIWLLKQWCSHSDPVLKRLAQQLINRNLPKIKIQENPFSSEEIKSMRKRIESQNFPEKEADYFVFHGYISNQTYFTDQTQILIKEKSGKVEPMAKYVPYLDSNVFSSPHVKHYLCYPKQNNS
ncbi:MAG: HD domain-containing protein [Flavobacteriia bacterium]|nr:HD domain-containing protein [Flavobacteriia bacterium]